MVDIYARPTKEEVEKLRDYLGDPFLWFVMKGVIKSLNEQKYTESCKDLWFSLTRRMFKNYPAVEVHTLVEKALEEASDEQWFEKKWMNDKTFPKRDIDYKPKRKSVIKINLKKSRTRKLINDNLKIIQVAKDYGIKVKGNMAICPFHEDKAPSLSLSDEKNVFNCFGCRAKGDIVEFIRRLENAKRRS